VELVELEEVLVDPAGSYHLEIRLPAAVGDWAPRGSLSVGPASFPVPVVQENLSAAGPYHHYWVSHIRIDQAVEMGYFEAETGNSVGTGGYHLGNLSALDTEILAGLDSIVTSWLEKKR